MTPALLVEAVAAEIEQAVKDYKLKAEGQADKRVTVYRQHIPDEDFRTDTYYPLAIVSWQGSQDGEDGSLATVGVTFGVYGDDKEAWRDLLSIMERTRQRLLIFRKLADRFRLQLPTKFETIENQPCPFWFGYATLVYTIATPTEELAGRWREIMEEDNE